jgi:hypothetical protein
MDRLHQRKITRNREFRACASCRKSKLKCDRQLPCSACTKRSEAASCFYEKRLDSGENELSRRLQAEAKLGHLQQLVEQLSHSQQISTTSESTTPKTSQHGPDQITNESLHNGSTHWSAMLEDIEELRATMTSGDDIDDGDVCFDGNDDDGISLLFGATGPLSFNQIQSQYLPPRNEADRLVAAYFRAKAIAAPFIHSAQFNRHYRLFWDSPSAASPLWTSIMFSILDITSRTVSTSTPNKPGENNITRFARAAALCLVVGQFHKPQKLAVEALLLYAQARCILSVSISPSVAILFGTLIRLATVLGYHIDSGSRDDVSLFDVEMRRRTWSLCMQLDLLVSFQLGLPSNIQFPTWDTKPPSNLLDTDFDEDTVQVPQPRPLFEPTEIVFYIAKHKLMFVFEKILRHTLSPLGQSTPELDMIDAELRLTYEDLPSVFYPEFITDSITKTPSLIVTRLCVNAIYQKCICVLHRKYVIAGRLESIQKCYDASTDLVRRFVDIYNEFEPGGQLETERWFRGSITWHDFLLGCTALCLTVCSTKEHLHGQPQLAVVDVPASVELLWRAKVVVEKRTPNKDSLKVRRLISAVLLKFRVYGHGSSIAMQDHVDGGPYQLETTDLLAMPSSLENADWQWDDTLMMPVEDPAWTYLQQFLDLPSDSSISET